MKAKNRNKTKYVARTRTKPKRKKKGNDKRLHEFKAKGQSEKVNIELIKMEKTKFYLKSIMFGGGMLAGIAFTFSDIRDEGLLFEGLGFKFCGSIVGILLIILSIILYSRVGVRAEIEN